MTDTASTTGIEDHTSYEGSAEQIAGVAPTALQKFDHEEFNTLKNTIDQHAPLINTLIADLLGIIAESTGVTLASLKRETDALNSILSADDTALDTAQERVDKIKQLLADIDSLVIADIAGLQTTLDSLQTGKEATGVAQSLVTALEATIRGAGAVGVTLTSLKSETDALNAILSSDDSTLDTAQERVDKIKQLLSDIDTLAIGDVAGLQSALDDLQTAIDDKEATGVAAALFAELNLNAIAETKAITPVDVFIYDTRKDSDCGAWRHRTQSTSWYQEELNTATRGSRREFPSLAVIVAEADKVTIYDADDPELPMWMVFNSTSVSSMLRAAESIEMLDSLMVVGSGDVGVQLVNFRKDAAQGHRANNLTTFQGDWTLNIASRNESSTNWSGVVLAGGLASTSTNDVAITVLDDAPVDQATGLPVPTIGVTHADGVSIIKHDDSIVDKTGYLSSENTIEFLDTGEYVTQYLYSYSCAIYPNSDTDSDFNSDRQALYYPASVGADNPYFVRKLSGSITGIRVAGPTINIASTQGLSVIHRHNDEFRSMAFHLTSKYPSGWMVGDIKAAMLASTDTSFLVETELVQSTAQSGAIDNSSNNTPWSSPEGTGKWSISSDVITRSDTSAWESIRRSFVFESGKAYSLTMDVAHTSGTAFLYFIRDDNTVEQLSEAIDSSGTITWFIQNDSSSNINLIQIGATDFVGSLSNLSIKLADHDRSVHAKGLAVHGTLTRAPVATGAELACYSGFSSTNYFEQPYNADLDFGTGDFSIMCWYKSSGDNSECILSRQDAIAASGFGVDPYIYFGKGGGSDTLYISMPGNTLANTSGTKINNNVYHFVCAVRKNNVMALYVDSVKESEVSNTVDINNSGAVTKIGVVEYNGNKSDAAQNISLLRISATAPTADQLAKIYHDERKLFQENAQCTIYGTSNNINAMDFDDVTKLLHVGTSNGRSAFDGLVRVDNTTESTSVIAAHDGLLVEG